MLGELIKVRILLGTDILGRPTVLAADNWGVRSDAAVVSTYAADLGICDDKDCPRPGLYVFEGTVGVEVYDSAAGGREPEVTYRGRVRSVYPREIDELFAMDSFEPESKEKK